jgi:hypothetical protein
MWNFKIKFWSFRKCFIIRIIRSNKFKSKIKKRDYLIEFKAFFSKRFSLLLFKKDNIRIKEYKLK